MTSAECSPSTDTAAAAAAAAADLRTHGAEALVLARATEWRSWRTLRTRRSRSEREECASEKADFAHDPDAARNEKGSWLHHSQPQKRHRYS